MSAPSRWGGWAAAAFLLTHCVTSSEEQPAQPPAAVVLSQVQPKVVMVGTRIWLQGNNLGTSASHVLHLSGSAHGPIDWQAPVAPLNPQEGEVVVDSAMFDRMGEGAFQGEAWVVSSNPVGDTVGQHLPTSLTFSRHLDPTLKDVGDGLVYLNSKVTILGDSFLLGGLEGSSVVELKGCFLPETTTGDCAKVGQVVDAQAPLTPTSLTDRGQADFEFLVNIAGIIPGAFDGTVSVINVHADSVKRQSKPLAVKFQLDRTRIHRVDQKSVSLGQYLDIRGAGFAGGDTSSTSIHFQGTFAPQGGTSRQVTFDLVAGYKNGGWIRQVAEETIGLGSAVKLRSERGTLAGTWTPTVYWNSSSQQGMPVTLTLQIAPVKQVVWVRFIPGWHESLARFGLQAADPEIRNRVIQVLRRDYGGTNIDFREDEPQDFKLYARVDVGGKDPNGLGLLGYDNTPGKDVLNKRLYDWLGGVNALTQQDGYPGYGGVFVESMLGFSQHPPSGVYKSPLASDVFDAVFDAFRPDRGSVLTSSEALVTGPADTRGCPTTDRAGQGACAIRILGNIVGSTTSHELGHSLGLADPFGSLTEYHNPGDRPNRLMEAGQGRPLEERAELFGQGPAVFCDDEYAYLKQILPLDPPQDPAVNRPSCY